MDDRRKGGGGSVEKVDKASNFFMSSFSFLYYFSSFSISHSHPLTFWPFSISLFFAVFLLSCPLSLLFLLVLVPPPLLPPLSPPPPHSFLLFLLQMFEAKEQRGDLIRELRSTHALQSPEQKEKRREKMEVLSKQTRRLED